MLTFLTFLATIGLANGATRAETRDNRFNKTIRAVEQMVWDNDAQRLARRHGLSLVNVSWEDTGRSKNSSWGPNISDMTIGVRDSRGALHPMPVFRFDNFHDKTADLDADDMWVRTGNESGERLRTTRLVDLLDDVKSHLHDPSSFGGREDSLLANRDSHLLVSAQACFLPISSSGKATFTPVLYNYQSQPGNPAVMTIVATREGTSVQVVENDSGYMSEVLYFNDDGDRAPFTATRLSTFKANGGDATTSAREATEDAGLDVVLVIQVPLKHRTRTRSWGYTEDAVELESLKIPNAAPMASGGGSFGRRKRSDVETAVLGHGPTEGRHKEINDLTIVRDTRFPIRVTAQFYKATSNGVITNRDVAELKAQIDKVYASGDFVGSLVTGGTTHRPTEWIRPIRTYRGWDRPIETWHKAF